MSARNIITGGFGSFGSPANIIVEGFLQAAPGPDPGVAQSGLSMNVSSGLTSQVYISGGAATVSGISSQTADSVSSKTYVES